MKNSNGAWSTFPLDHVSWSKMKSIPGVSVSFPENPLHLDLMMVITVNNKSSVNETRPFWYRACEQKEDAVVKPSPRSLVAGKRICHLVTNFFSLYIFSIAVSSMGANPSSDDIYDGLYE